MPNNSCKICNSYLKEVFDNQLVANMSPEEILYSIEKRIKRTLSINEAIEKRFNFRRSRSVLNDKDKNEMSWISGEIRKKEHLLKIKEEDILEHLNHSSYCSHIHPTLDCCEKLCKHVTRYDPEIVIDGVVVLKDVIEYSDMII